MASPAPAKGTHAGGRAYGAAEDELLEHFAGEAAAIGFTAAPIEPSSGGARRHEDPMDEDSFLASYESYSRHAPAVRSALGRISASAQTLAAMPPLITFPQDDESVGPKLRGLSVSPVTVITLAYAPRQWADRPEEGDGEQAGGLLREAVTVPGSGVHAVGVALLSPSAWTSWRAAAHRDADAWEEEFSAWQEIHAEWVYKHWAIGPRRLHFSFAAPEPRPPELASKVPGPLELIRHLENEAGANNRGLFTAIGREVKTMLYASLAAYDVLRIARIKKRSEQKRADGEKKYRSIADDRDLSLGLKALQERAKVAP